MERVRVSKIKYQDCADMHNYIYRVSIQVRFGEKYRSMTISVAANDEKAARSYMESLMAKYEAPTDFDDETGFDAFCDSIINDIKADPMQSKYFITEEEKAQRVLARLRALGMIE